MAKITDGNPERSFFRKFQTLGLGQTNCAEKCRGIWGISPKLQYSSWHCESLLHGLEYLVVVFCKKNWISGLKHITLKYDIGRKEFKR